MPILSNPLLTLMPPIKVPSLNEPPESKRDHDTLVNAVQALLALVGAEFHEESMTKSVNVTIPHRLGRKPKLLLWTAPTEPIAVTVYVPDPGRSALWSDRHIVLRHDGGGLATVYFALL